MPKVGPYKIPNHDIDTVVELIDEAAQRLQQVEATMIDEETFQNQIIQRQGGSYNRYRYSLQLYGFIERQHGADEVRITNLFVDVADPIPKSKRPDAIAEALENVPILGEMYEAEFEPELDTERLRVWLVQGLNIPREEANEESAGELKELYGPAYPYLDRVEEEEPEAEEPPPDEEDSPDWDGIDGQIQKDKPNFPSDGEDDREYEEFKIGDRYVRLPRENISQEWELLKATVDAYVSSLDRGGDEEGN